MPPITQSGHSAGGESVRPLICLTWPSPQRRQQRRICREEARLGCAEVRTSLRRQWLIREEGTEILLQPLVQRVPGRVPPRDLPVTVNLEVVPSAFSVCRGRARM